MPPLITPGPVTVGRSAKLAIRPLVKPTVPYLVASRASRKAIAPIVDGSFTNRRPRSSRLMSNHESLLRDNQDEEGASIRMRVAG